MEPARASLLTSSSTPGKTSLTCSRWETELKFRIMPLKERPPTSVVLFTNSNNSRWEFIQI